jgi:hypothetical protein
MKKRSLAFLMILAILTTWFSTTPLVGHAAEDVLYAEDFEGYALNTYPTSFTLLYSGTGAANQKIIADTDYLGVTGKVFRLQGAPNWASEHLRPLPSTMPDTLIIQAYVKPISGTWPGRIGLYNPNVGTWGTRISAVLFGSGNITALRNSSDGDSIALGTYTVGTWYKVTMIHDMSDKTYDVKINDVLLAENLPMSQSIPATHLNLTAGNIGTNEIYYDNVRMLAADTTAPTLTAGTVARTSDSEATVHFTTDDDGVYFYEVVSDGATAPILDTTGTGVSCSTGDVPLSLTGLATGDLDLYIQMKDLAGNVSNMLLLDLPAFVPPVYGTLQFDFSGMGTYEGANSYIGVERIGGTDGAVSVQFASSDGTALAGTHYVSGSGTLTWADGEGGKKYFSYSIIDNSVYEGYKTYYYTLSSPTGGATISGVNPVSIQRSDNEQPPTPSGLTLTPGDGSITANWSEVDDAYYYLYYWTNDSDEQRVEIYDGTSALVTGLDNGVTYYFAVRAGHNIYFSPTSEPVTSVPMAQAVVEEPSDPTPTVVVPNPKTSDPFMNERNSGRFSFLLLSLTGLLCGILFLIYHQKNKPHRS